MTKIPFVAIGLAVVIIGSWGVADPTEERRNDHARTEAAIDSAIRLMDSSDSLARIDAVALVEAAFITGQPSASRAVPPLVNLLENDSSLSVRISVVKAIGASGERTAADALLRTATNEDIAPLLRAVALQELAGMSLRKSEVLTIATDNIHRDDLRMRHVAIDVLLSDLRQRYFVKSIVEAYEKQVVSPDRRLMTVPPLGGLSDVPFENAYEELSWHLLTALDSIGSITPDLVVPLFKHSNDTVRTAAVKSAVPGLLTWLKPDKPIGSRLFAVGALAGSADERAFEALLEMAQDDSLNRTLRERALRGVIGIDKEAPCKRLSRLLWRLAEDGNADSAVRARAIDELWKRGIRKRKLLKIASENLRSLQLEVRYSSMRILAESEDTGNLKTLIHAYVEHYEAPDSLLKAKQPLSWGMLPRNPYDNAYEETSWYFWSHIRSIARSRPELLYPLLNHPDTELVLHVASTFEGTPDTRPVPVLVRVLKTDANWEHRFRAVGLLNKVHLGDSKGMAISALQKALGDEYVEQTPDGRDRPVARRAYLVLKELGVEVGRPDDIILRPDQRRIILE